MDIVKRISTLAKEQGYNIAKIQKELGMASGLIYSWKKASPNISNLQKVADFLNVPVSQLFSEDIPDEEEDLIDIAVVGSVSAGLGIFAEENISEYKKTPRSPGMTAKNHFYLEVVGDSMEPKIPDGSLVLVKKQNTVNEGEVGIVFFPEDEKAVVKKVHFEDNHVELISFNQKYDPIIVDEYNQGIIEGKAVSVVFDL